jgi:hypothetical protein
VRDSSLSYPGKSFSPSVFFNSNNNIQQTEKVKNTDSKNLVSGFGFGGWNLASKPLPFYKTIQAFILIAPNCPVLLSQ